MPNSEIDILKENGELLRTIIETVPQYIWRTNVDGSADYFSDRFCQFVGCKFEDLTGWGWFELIHPDDKADVAAEWARCRANQIFVTREFRIRKNDEWCWVLAEGNPYFDARGVMTKYYGTWTDIHQRKIDAQKLLVAQDAANVEASKLSLITNALPAFVSYVDLSERYQFVNDAYEEWFLRKREDTVGKHVLEVQGVETYAVTNPFLKRALSGEHVQFETKLRHNGRERDVVVDYIPHRNAASEVLGVIKMAFDITARKNVEMELQRAKEAAEMASDAKTAFLANMSHEIRTPLAAISGFSELLGDAVPDTSDAKDYLRRILTNSAQLRNLIDELLDLSKIEANRFEMEKDVVNIKRIMDDSFSTISLKAREKGIEFELTWASAIPEQVLTDETRFRQVLINVLGNAVKFTERGKISVELMVVEQESRELLQITITDSGIGMTPAQQAKVFEPFTQADATVSRRFGGTGLGLSLSRKLSRLLGGDLKLKSSVPGSGSTFVITIDISNKPAAMLKVPFATSQSLAKDKSKVLTGKTILVVDDAPDNQRIVSLFIQGVGGKTQIASNGSEAVSLALSQHFDVVLMDIQMPVMDGMQAINLLRENNYQRPVVALTAHAMREERDRCIKAGFTEHMPKPIDRAALIEMLSRLSKFADAPASH